MILVMSPRTRTSFMSIRLGMASWVIPRETLASPRPTHLHHHPSSLQRQLPPVLHPILRTRCSHLLSTSTHSGMRPRSTESSSLRIWRLYGQICVRCWPTRPLFCSSSRPYRHRSPSSWLFTNLHHHHCSDHQGSPLHIYCLFLASGDTGYFVWGGGGVVIGFLFYLLMFCFFLVVCSVFILFSILVVFRFSFSYFFPLF